MDTFEKEYKDVIAKLEELHAVHASETVRNRVRHVFVPSLPSKKRSYSIFAFPAIRVVVLLFALLIVSGSGMVLAAKDTRPGELLYPVKHFVEDMQLTWTSNPAEKATIHLNKADKNVQDIKQAADKKDTTHMNQAAKEYEKEVQEVKNAGKDAARNNQELHNTINQHLQQNTKQLQQVREVVPTTAQSAIQHAIDVSSQEQTMLHERNHNDNTNEDKQHGNQSNNNVNGQSTVEQNNGK